MINHFFKLLLIIGFLHLPLTATEPQLPEINWTQRSDWTNVKQAPYNAKGDGVSDDTAAINAAFAAFNAESTRVVYFPPGMYRISASLRITGYNSYSGLIIGHGRSTVIRWAGAIGGTMCMSQGYNWNHWNGLTWDGAGIAANGISHGNSYETGNMHENEKFMNFTNAGLFGGSTTAASSEMRIYNCLFVGNLKGVAFEYFNYYNEAITGCGFYSNSYGVYAATWGQVIVKSSHFEGNSVSDLRLGDSQGHSVMRCTSTGSKKFVEATSNVLVGDCQISGWTNTAGAITFSDSRYGLMVYDCVFTNPPNTTPPIVLTGSYQKLTLSQNISAGTTAVLTPGIASTVVTVPAGIRSRNLTSANQTFFKSSLPTPGQVFDAKAMGAQGNEWTDDTVAVQATINAAKAAGNGAIAYFPAGTYTVKSTIVIDGGGYTVAGAGLRSRFLWDGANTTSAVMFSVSNPAGIVLADFLTGRDGDNGAVWTHILHTATSNTSYAEYNNVVSAGSGRNLHIKDLASGAIVNLPAYYSIGYNDHYCQVSNSRGVVLGGHFMPGALLVDGTASREGLCGAMLMNSIAQYRPVVRVDNSQDFVCETMYLEQGNFGLLTANGNNGDTPGRLTIGGIRLHTWVTPGTATLIDVQNYRGRITQLMTCYTWDNSPNPYVIRQTGTNAVNMLFVSATLNEGSGSTTFNLSPTADLGVIACPHTTENSTASDLQEAAYALDDFRRLGAKDLELNYNIVTVPPTPPTTPTGLTASPASSGRINLSWTDTSNNEEGFTIERSVNGTVFNLLATVGVGMTTYADTTVAASTAYWYRIKAVNTAGSSAFSNIATTTTPVVQVPAAPTGLIAHAAWSGQIDLTWTDVASNETGYRIERSTDGITFTTLVSLAANTASFSNLGLTASTRYWYRVRAYNAVGNSASSNLADATTPAAGPISLLNGLIPEQLNATDGVAYELGMKFRTSVPGTITAIRYWKASSEGGAHTGRLWSATGTQLASVVFTGETASGWQQATLTAPLNMTANTMYVVTVNCNSHYVATVWGLATAITRSPLSSVVGQNGVFGPIGTFPTQSWSDSNYFRDVLFTPKPTVRRSIRMNHLGPITGWSILPAAGASTVTTDSTVFDNLDMYMDHILVPVALPSGIN